MSGRMYNAQVINVRRCLLQSNSPLMNWLDVKVVRLRLAVDVSYCKKLLSFNANRTTLQYKQIAWKRASLEIPK